MKPTSPTVLPLVSIIVITFNSSKYVLETLESSKAQTYQNIELIVSDDCSTDATPEICKKWIEENKNRFVRTEFIEAQKNTGIPGNCNRGLNVAQGEWIKFIAGDDVLMANCVVTMLSFSIANNSHLATSAIEEFCEGGLPARVSNSILLKQLIFFKKNNKDQFKFYLRDSIFLNSPAFLIKKDLFNKIGVFDESFRMLEDTPFVIRTLKAGYVVYYNQEVTVRYRTYPQAENRVRGQSEDMFLCFDKYQRPYLNIINIIDMFVIYNWFLINQTRKARNKCANVFYRLLLNVTSPIYIRGKRAN